MLQTKELTNHTVTGNETLPKKTVIKIKSPKTDIKVHKIDLSDSRKIPLALPSKKNLTSSHIEDVDKITKCWNNLKLSALSKAIVMAPDVGSCTIGPQAGNDRPDPSQMATSTPFKSNSDMFDHLSNNQHNSIDPDESEISVLDTLKTICHNKVELFISKCVQEKRETILKSWSTHDKKLKEKCFALKVELDNKRIMRLEERDSEVQKIILETETNAQEKTGQQQQLIKVHHDKRIAETGEKLRLIEQKKIEVEEKRKKSLEELRQLIEQIFKSHVSYNQIYSDICEKNKTCKDIRLLNEKVSGEIPRLKEMNRLMFNLAEKTNEGKVTIEDIKSAETLVRQIKVICSTFSRSVDEINKSVKKLEIDGRENELIEKESKANDKANHHENISVENERITIEKIKHTSEVEYLVSRVKDCVSGESLKWHQSLYKYLEDYEQQLQPLLTDDSLKKFRFDCQKVVNVPVNAISPLDDLHLKDKLYKLSRLLSGQAVPLNTTMFLATSHPAGVMFCTNLLASKFVKQGEHSVSSKPEAAFAIASVIVALWADFPDFGRLLLAHFHRECPYLIPAFMPQLEGQSNEDYYRLLGYQYSEEGEVEPQDKFLRRMSGMMRLYAAILITPLKKAMAGRHHPHGMREAWRWLTCTLNLSPRSDITATLLFDFLEVAGNMMLQTYRIQFTKLLQFLCTDYFFMIEQVTPEGRGGPVTRLRIFLEKILKDGQVPPPMGLLPANFW